jgi:hypothetical protein
MYALAAAGVCMHNSSDAGCGVRVCAARTRSIITYVYLFQGNFE